MKARALLKLFQGTGKRQIPLFSDYRPISRFPNSIGATSGRIVLIGCSQMNPGEEKEVFITFLNEKLLGPKFEVGITGHFAEAIEPLGEVEIIEIYVN